LINNVFVLYSLTVESFCVRNNCFCFT